MPNGTIRIKIPPFDSAFKEFVLIFIRTGLREIVPTDVKCITKQLTTVF
jgi:hypothetical protein